MKKIVIIIVSLFLLLSAVNFVGSEPSIHNNSTLESNNSIDTSIFNEPHEQRVLQNINRLDGFFTENQGQVGNDSVRYYIQGKGVWFLDDGVVFEIQEPPEQTEVQRDPYNKFHPKFEPETPQPRKNVVLKLNFEGCNEVKPKGISMLPHRSNFFYGNDSTKWCTNVPNYQEIIYENIYDNIDLRYYSSANGLKYDFIIYPGGEPSDIRMRYEGAQDVSIESSGELNIHTEMGELVDSELFIYQNPENSRTVINGKFEKLAPKTYGFEIIGKYDRNKAIIIDPLVYSTYIGGSDNDYGYSIAVNTASNTYVTGRTYSSDFSITPGANDTIHNGVEDVFVFKLDPTGSSLLYSTFIGGSGADEGSSIAIDISGNAYVTGYTSSSDFPTTSSANDTTYNGGSDLFVFKLNPTGASLLYSTFIGGSGADEGWSITIDTNGNAYVTGYTYSSDFPTTSSANDTTFNGGSDLFVFKLNPTGASLLYSTFIGGSDGERGDCIAVDTGGNTYVTGYTGSLDFPTTLGAYDTIYNGDADIFVLKLNPTGSSLLYSTFIGNSNDDHGYSIAVDTYGCAYVTGYTISTNFPTTLGAYNTTHNGWRDIFVCKLDPTGSSLLYSTFIGGSSEEYGYSIAIDTTGNSYVTGYTSSLNFPITPSTYDNTYNGGEDVFVCKLNSTGSLLLYSTFIGQSNDDHGYGIAVDPNNDAYVTGYTSSSNFPTTPGANDTTYNGGIDLFVLKLHINYLPNVLDLMVSDHTVLRANSIYLYSNATDFEDLEQNLTPYFEYRDPNEQVWNITHFSKPQYTTSRWEVNFTPQKNATLGLYDFRVRYNDTFPSLTNWFYLNNSLLVLNNIPLIKDIALSNNSAILGDSISIWTNATDVEEIEENLTIELEYRNPSELSWEKIYLSIPTYNNGRWESSFYIPFDALFGYYDFRTRVNDSDGNYSAWVYLNDSLLIYNTGPKVIDVGLSEVSIYRTESIFVYVNGSDYETPEDMLSFYIQHKPQSEGEWTNLTGNYLNNKWDVNFITTIVSILGNYDFRVKFEDNESASSGWRYINDSFEVLNNLPSISEDLDDISVGIQPLTLDLTPYESDIEDTDINLNWSINPQTYTYIESIEIIDLVSDTLKIVPKANITGTEDIELSLIDKDSGTVVKSDITIIVDSLTSDLIPFYKVNLTSEKGSIIIRQGESRVLNQTVKNEGNSIDNYKIEYSSANLLSHISIDKNNVQLNPNIDAPLKLNINIPDDFAIGDYSITVTATSLTDITAKDEVTIDVKVVFKDFVTEYNVNISVTPSSLNLKPGESDNVTITITNDGNIEDDFTIRFESDDFNSADIQFSNISLTLPDGDLDTITVTIKIPEDMEPGEYTIKFIVESDDASKESTLTITVPEKDGGKPKDGDEDNTMLYALIVIIVIIIIALILLFIYLKKKKGKEEEEPIVEELPPEEVPPEQVPTPETPPPEQSPLPEVPPEQPPTPEVTPQVVPQVEPTQPAPVTQVEEQPVPIPQVEQPQPQVAVQEPPIQQPAPQPVVEQAPVTTIKTQPTVQEE